MTKLQQILWLLAWWGTIGAQIHTGYAPHYGRTINGVDIMNKVAHVRDLPLVECMVSSARYPVGTWVYVVSLKTETYEYCRVTDVSNTTRKCRQKIRRCESDGERHLRTRRELELSYEAGLRICGARAMRERPEACPIIIIYLGGS